MRVTKDAVFLNAAQTTTRSGRYWKLSRTTCHHVTRADSGACSRTSTWTGDRSNSGSATRHDGRPKDAMGDVQALVDCQAATADQGTYGCQPVGYAL